MTLLPCSKLLQQKMRVLLQVYRLLLPLIPGCVWCFWDHFKGLDVVFGSCLEFAGPRGAVLLTATPQWSGEKTVQLGRMDSSSKQSGLAEDKELPFSRLTPGAAMRAIIHVNMAPFIYP